MLEFDDTSTSVPSPRRVSMNGNVQPSSQLSASSSAGSSSSIFDFHEDHSLTKNNKKCVIHHDDCKTPEGGRVSAVSSNTSLSAARRFFRQLDQEHHLSIATESKSPTPKRQRRTRVIKRSGKERSSCKDLQLDQEYKDYKAACEDSCVSPLPKAEYVSNRGAYFRSTELYDGLLDE